MRSTRKNTITYLGAMLITGILVFSFLYFYIGTNPYTASVFAATSSISELNGTGLLGLYRKIGSTITRKKVS